MESSYDRAVTFLQDYWRSILVGLLILLTGIVAVMFVMRSRADAEQRAHVYWLRAQQDEAAGEYASALEYANTLLSEHGGTTSGRRAAIIKGDALAGLGRYDEALAAYGTASERLDGDPLLETAALRGQAAMLENLGRHREAAMIWEPLAESATPVGGRVFDLKNAARNLAAAGDTAAAIAAYERLIERYGDSTDRIHVQEVHLAKVAAAELRYAAPAAAAESAPTS